MSRSKNGKASRLRSKATTSPAAANDVPPLYLHRDPSKPKLNKHEIPPAVLAYLTSAKTARDHGVPYPKPTGDVSIVNWLVVKEVPVLHDEDIKDTEHFHLGASWYKQVSTALTETMTAENSGIVRAANASEGARASAAQHDAADLDAARILVILSSGTSREDGVAAAPEHTRDAGAWRLAPSFPLLATPRAADNYGYTLHNRNALPQPLEIQKRKPGRPKKVVSFDMTATELFESGAETKNVHNLAFEELEDQDVYRFDAGNNEAEVGYEDSDVEMSDKADENFCPPGKGRQNKRRKISGGSDVGASSRLMRSPVKRHTVRRISSGTDLTSKKVARTQSSMIDVGYDVDEEGMASIIQDVVAPIHVQKGPKQVRLIIENPGGAAGHVEPMTEDFGERGRPRRAPSSAGRIAAVNKSIAARSAAERALKLIDPDTTGDSDSLTSADMPMPTRSSNAKQTKERAYKGKWKTTTTGPLKDDKVAQKARVAKNNTSCPEDKVWDCLHHPLPKTRAKALREGVDVDDAAATVDYLTLRLSLRKSPQTKMEIKYDPPANWDDQKEITALIKVITQHRRRWAGVKNDTRHAYMPEEKQFLAKYFQDHPDLQGPKGMSRNEQWEGLAAIFNVQFKGRKSKIASRGGLEVEVPERSWHAIMALCDRDVQIATARKLPVASKTADERKDIDVAEEMVAEQDSTDEEDNTDEEDSEEVLPTRRKRARMDVDDEDLETPPRKRVRPSKAR